MAKTSGILQLLLQLSLHLPWSLVPSRTVRILGQQSKSDEPPTARLDIVMGVPEEFLLTELWYCQNHERNPQFSDPGGCVASSTSLFTLSKSGKDMPSYGHYSYPQLVMLLTLVSYMMYHPLNSILHPPAGCMKRVQNWYTKGVLLKGRIFLWKW